MACLSEKIVNYPEFKQLVSDSGYSQATVFDIIQRWLNDDPDKRGGKFPSLDELLSYYDNKSFFTDNKDIIEAYKRPLTSERVFGMMSSSEDVRNHINQMTTIFGKDNVFIYENQDGDTVVKVAKPIAIKEDRSNRDITLEDIESAKKLLRNKIEHIEGVISWIEERVKWKKATKEQLQELEDYKKQLSDAQELWDGLDTGTSEVYINEHGYAQIRKSNGLDIRTISSRTDAFGVELSNGSKDFWNKVNSGWQNDNPNGIVAYRKHGDNSQSFSPDTVEQGWIGNPFSVEGKSKDIQTAQQFYDWLVTGNNFGNHRATEEFRQAIVKKILATPKGSPILYYTVLQGPSHATVIGYLIDHKELLGGKKEEPAPKKVPELPIVLLPAIDSDLRYFNKPTSNAVSTSYEDKPWKEPFKFFSGGEPKGADAAWGSAARQLGIEVKDFTVDDYNALPESEKNKIEREYQEVVSKIGRRALPSDDSRGQLVRRDMMQADNADAIFAVGNFDGMFVEGGTAYATMRGILLGIPVHFFNQDNATWYIWDEQKKAFTPEDAPLLTQHAAVIGTEHLDAVGNREIVNTLQRTGRYYGFINDKESEKQEIKLTDEQQNVVNHAVSFIESKLSTGNTASGKKFLTIQGMAGTGKTTIVRNIIQRLREDSIYGDIAVSALSRKAVHVLSSKLSDLGVQTETLYTLAGAKVNESEKQFDIDPKKEKFSRYSIIFVDEASMVGDSIMNAISSYLDTNPNTVVVFLGDYGQVRPIAQEDEESQKSGVFHRDDTQVETLTERIRQGEGSPILGYADKFYAVSTGKSRAKLLPNPNRKDIKSIINDSGALLFAGNIGNVFTRVVDAFKKAVSEKNPNYIKIVSSTNQNVDSLNQRIHKAIFPNSNLDIDAGDLIIFNSPYEKLDIENATEGIVESVGDIKTDSNGIQYQEYYISINGGRSVTVNRLVQTDSNIQLFNDKVRELKNKAKSTRDKADWRAYYALIGSFADLSLGYAMTIHKAQGSTYDMVVVDEQGIRKDGAWENQERAEIMYTALTRSRNVTISLAGVEDSGTKSFIELNNEIERAKHGSDDSGKDSGRPKNRSIRLYLKGQEERGYFEVVKDFEEGYYSVHFKPTDSDNPHAFSEKEKDILFKAVADVIPLGAYVSTYGSVSKGGIHGLSRLTNLGFAETDMTRPVKMKDTGKSIRIPIYRKLEEFNDGSVSSAIEASLRGQMPGEKPRGNIVTTPIVEFTELSNIGKSVKTIQISMLESATSDSVVKAIEDRIDNDKEQVATIGARIVPNTSSTKRFIKSVKALNRVNSVMLKKGRPLPSQYDIPIANLNKEELKALRRLGLSEIDGKFQIPTYIIGMSDEDLARKEQRANLMAQGKFTEAELREYAKRAVFKLSDAITRLQNGDTALLSSLVDSNSPNRDAEIKALTEDRKGNPIDYTKMSRIDILRKIGIGRAFAGFVRRPIFEYAAGKNWSFKRKAEVISKNWEAFLELAYDTLINMEEVTLADAKGKVGELGYEIDDSTGELSQGLSAETEAEISEVFGSAVEYWQVGFRQVSAFHSLSTDIRNTFGKLLDLNSEGRATVDDFGMERTIDSAEAVAKVLSWTQHAIDLKGMIDALKAQVNDNPWLRQLVGEGETSYVDRDGNTKVGILVDKQHSGFQSRFFSNFKKYFQSYTVTYFDRDGNVRMRTVNNNPYEDESIGNLRTLNQNGQLRVWDEKSGSLTEAYDELSDIIGFSEIKPTRWNEGRKASGLYIYKDRLNEVIESKGEKELVEADRQALLKDIYRAYELLNIELPSFEVFSTLMSPQDMSDAITTLGHVIVGIEDAADIAEHGGYFQIFASRKEQVVPKGSELEGNIKPVNLTSNFRKLLQLISPAMTTSREIVSYEGGKLFYACVAPSYLGILTDKLKGFTGDQTYDEFIQEEYFKYEGIFKNSEKRPSKYGPKGVLNYMLSRLTDEKEGEDVRDILDHVTSLTYDGVQYADKTKPQYYASMVSMFLYDVHGKRAFYRIPTMSNKPSEEYIRFERMSSGTYKSTIVDWLAEKTFYQELNRMRTVADRAKAEEKAKKSGDKDAIREANDRKIENFDKKGRDREFFFMPFLNKYVDGLVEDEEDKEFSKSLNKIIDGKGLNPTTNEGKRFMDYLKRVIEKELDAKFEEFLVDAEKAGFITMEDGVISEVYQIDDRFVMDDYPSAEDYRKEVLREFFWQDFFMSGNILQLTITDISMYKNAEDLQKRLAQLHAPGMRPNIAALDISTGNRVSDDYSRYVILKDEKIASDIVTNLKVARDRAVKRAKGQDKNIVRRKYDSIIKEFEKKDAINFADAQAFSSPTSYRKKMHWFGKWDARQEDAYKKVISGNYTEDDLDILWQPLKPFVYAQIAKESGSEAIPLIKMGIQNKNSEYLLLMADALMRSEGVDSKLGAIYDVMEMSQGDWVGEGENRRFVQNGKGIDTFMFESAVKTGITGVIDLTGTKTPDQVRRFLWTGKGVLKKREGKAEDYNEIYVHTFHASSYTLQQEVPAHFKGEQQMGSQARIHAIADLQDYDANGKENTIIVNSKKIDEKGNYVTVPEEITIKEFKKRYQEAIVENIELSFEELSKELGLNFKNKKLRNVILSKILKDEIQKDGRLGSDLLWACDVDADGNFNIPLSDPVHSGRIQQLLNSLIKNRINKQEVAGGALVQVSSWGVHKSQELGIRFESKDGKLLYTRSEFDRIVAGENVETKFDRSKYVGVGGKDFSMYSSYEEYVAKNQYKVAYFEAYVPIYDDRLLKYQNADGVIDIKEIEKDDPQLLEMIGYRIPTEGKYSMIPIKVVGFLPRSGEGIMLPADITLLTGSDFDVDKLYIMRRAITNKRDIGMFISDFMKSLQEEQEEEHLDPDDLHNNRELIMEALNTPPSKKDSFSGGASFYDKVHKAYAQYKGKRDYGLTTHVTDRRGRNNNLIIDYLQAVLTSPLTTDQSMSPGNFDMVKEIGYLVAAYDNLSSLSREDLISTVANDILHVDISQLVSKPRSLILSQAFEALKDMDIYQLKDISYVKVSLLYANTQVKFQQQNSVAGKLIGVFAQANTSHGFMTLLDNPVFNISTGNGFVLNGKEFKGKVSVDTYYSLYDRKGRRNRISEVLASLLASSVDAVKDPVLNLFNINMTTVNIAIAMVRLGIPLDTIGWFLTTPIIKEAVDRFEMENMTESKPLSRVMFEMMDEINDRNGDALEYLENKDITTDDLIAWHNRPDEVEEEGDEELRFLTQFEEDANTDDDLSTQDKIDYQLLGMATRLLSIADGFRSVTHMTRYNSITSSVGPFMANTNVSKASDINFFMSPIIGENKEKAAPYYDEATGISYPANEVKRQIADNPIIKAFRKYSYTLESQLLGRNFIQGGRFGQRVFAEALRRFPNLNDETALRLSEFMVSYAMSSVKELPIFDLSDGETIETTRRRIILDTVPGEVMAAKERYPDNRFLKAIRTPVDERTGEVLMTINLRGRGETDTQDIKVGWTQLYRDEQERIARSGGTIQDNLAYKVIEYNFFRGGFGFSPKTFMRILPSELKLALPNYINNLKLDYDNVSISNLLDQFMLNYGYTNISDIDIKQLSDINKIPVGKFNEMQIVSGDKNLVLDEGVAIVLQPDGSKRWAVLRSAGKQDVFRFNYVDKLGGVENQGFEIDPTRNAWDIKSVFPQDGTRKASSGGQVVTSPSAVESYSQFEEVMTQFIANRSKAAKQLLYSDNLAEKLRVMRNFADKVVKDGSSVFNQIRDLLKELDLENITEDELNKLLDERNICR